MLIFKTTNILNGKIYVGTSTIDNPNFLGSTKSLLKDIRKFGIENFQREVLEEVKRKEELDERQKHYVESLNSSNPKLGYNTEAEADNELLSKKIQVLLTKTEFKNLNTIILNEAYSEQTRPLSVSSYVRKLIQEHITVTQADQKSYVKEKTKELV